MMQSHFVNCFVIIGHSGHRFHENTLHVRVLYFANENDNIHYCRIGFTFPMLHIFFWMSVMIILFSIVLSDENRDINIHMEEDIKRQRIQYNGEQIYPNVSGFKFNQFYII